MTKHIKIIFVALILAALPAVTLAADPQVEADKLMAKILYLLKADKASEALPYMAELEKLEPSLAKPLPESFHFYYIDTLDKAGEVDRGIRRANIYLEKFGKKGKHYGQVIEITSKLEMQAKRNEENRAAQARRDEENRAAQARRDEENRAAQKVKEQQERQAHCRKRDKLQREMNENRQSNACDQYLGNDRRWVNCWDELNLRYKSISDQLQREEALCW